MLKHCTGIDCSYDRAGGDDDDDDDDDDDCYSVLVRYRLV